MLIEQLDTLRIIDCDFRNCHATDDGGAIYSMSSTINPMPKYTKFKGCKFSGNTAQGNHVGNIDFYMTGPIYFQNCEFSDNTRIGVEIEFGDGVFIDNCIIRDNGGTGLNDSRAFYIQQTDTIYANGIIAFNNFTSWAGPVFYVQSLAKILVENSLFSGNYSDYISGVFYASSEIIFKNCQFHNNHASYGGVTSSERTTFEQCKFKGNNTSSYGGVLFNTGNNAGRYCNFVECELDSNSSGAGGGTIYVSHSKVKFEKSTVSNSYSAGDAGAFEINGFTGSARFINSTIANNYALGDGGAMLVSNIDSLIIKNSTFAHNKSNSSGNFAYFVWTDSMNIEGSIIINHGNPFAYYAQSPPIKIRSGGYNLLEFDNGNLLSTDIPNLDSTYQILDSLRGFGGIGKVMLPLPHSLAVNSGNPFDSSSSQNVAIITGRRDRGAAESEDSTIMNIGNFQICDSIYLNGGWQSAIGRYTDTALAASGADSITCIWIKSVNTAIVDTQFVVSCSDTTWIDGITYTMTTDSASVVFSTINGCDSVVYLNFTKLNTTFVDTQQVYSCGPFTWIDGIEYSESTDTPSVVLSSIYNCDSLVYLSLDIVKIDTMVNRNGSLLTAVDSGAQYQWVNCNQNFNPLPNGNQQQYLATQNGNYAVIITKNGCVDTSSCIEINDIGIESLIKPSFLVYPNPTKDHISFEVDVNFLSKEYIITDATGKLMIKGTIDQTKTTLIVEDWKPGEYIFNIEGIINQKFSVVK
jgi:hypothetical protein